MILGKPIEEVEGWWWHHGARLMEGFEWVLMAVGLIFCLWAFWRKRRVGFLLLAVYFFGPFLSVAVDEVRYQLNREYYDALRERARKDYEERLARGELIFTSTTIAFPLHSTMVLLGSVMLYRVVSSKREQVDGANE